MFLTQFVTVAIVHLFAVMSPGPDFAVVTKNSLMHSRKIGTYTALGIALGISVHIAYSLLGIGLVISKSVVLFSIIKYLGAGYLIYIGYLSLRAKPQAAMGTAAMPAMDRVGQLPEKHTISHWSAIKTGFLTNVLNPKATMFFLALFTQVIDPATPKIVQLFFGLEMMAITFAWFALLSSVFSNRFIKSKITRIQHRVEHATGVVLIALGIKVALASRE